MTAEEGVQDMTILSNIDEHGINTNLRVRYENDRIYVSIFRYHHVSFFANIECMCLEITSVHRL